MNNDDNSSFYFERQSWARCAIHCVNNVLQRAAVSRGEFDDECLRLAPDAHWLNNPHRSWLPGLGDYDANVLVNVLQANQCAVRFVDRRQRPLQLALDDESLLGFVVNVKRSRNLLFRLLGSGRHWFAVARRRESRDVQWALLDSLNDAPRLFDSLADVDAFLTALADEPSNDLNLLAVEIDHSVDQLLVDCVDENDDALVSA
jgi:hypothetical protein